MTLTNQLAYSSEGCMDTYLTLSGMWEIPNIYRDITDGYAAEVTNVLSNSVYSYGFEGTCFWVGDEEGCFCTVVIAGDQDFMMFVHDISYYWNIEEQDQDSFDRDDYYDYEEFYESQ